MKRPKKSPKDWVVCLWRWNKPPLMLMMLKLSYLELINEHGLEVFDETDEVECYNRNVKTVWGIASLRLSENAKHILYCFAYISPDLLAIDLLSEHAKTLHAENEKYGDAEKLGEIIREFRVSKFSPELIAVLANDIKRDKAVAELKNLSLVTIKTDKTLTMHSLLQEVIRSGVADGMYLLSVAEVLKRLCSKVNPIWSDYRVEVTIPQAKSLILNIETILRYQKEYDGFQGEVYSDIVGLPFEEHSLMAQYLFLRGVSENNTDMLEDADKCYEKACKLGEHFYGGGEDAELLAGAGSFTAIQEKHRRMRLNLVLGRAEVARGLYDGVRKPVSKSLKQEPGMSFHAFSNFGDLWNEYGFYAEAKECYEYALQSGLKNKAEALLAKIYECELNLSHTKAH
jgi:tetratricopeptide (TPR) repeat protein